MVCVCKQASRLAHVDTHAQYSSTSVWFTQACSVSRRQGDCLAFKTSWMFGDILAICLHNISRCTHWILNLVLVTFKFYVTRKKIVEADLELVKFVKLHSNAAVWKMTWNSSCGYAFHCNIMSCYFKKGSLRARFLPFLSAVHSTTIFTSCTSKNTLCHPRAYYWSSTAWSELLEIVLLCMLTTLLALCSAWFVVLGCILCEIADVNDVWWYIFIKHTHCNYPR